MNSFQEWLNQNPEIFKSNNKLRLEKIPGQVIKMIDIFPIQRKNKMKENQMFVQFKDKSKKG